jgi:hypothetical protein
MTQEPNPRRTDRRHHLRRTRHHSSSTVLALCRKLVKDGYDPSLPLEAWRGAIRNAAKAGRSRAHASKSDRQMRMTWPLN